MTGLVGVLANLYSHQSSVLTDLAVYLPFDGSTALPASCVDTDADARCNEPKNRQEHRQVFHPIVGRDQSGDYQDSRKGKNRDRDRCEHGE